MPRKFTKRSSNTKRKDPGAKALKMVKTLVKAKEHKINNFVISQSGAVGAGGFQTLFLPVIQQGDGPSQRLGNKIYLEEVKLKLDTRCSGDLTIIPKMRILIVQDLQQLQDTAPSVGDILLNGSYFNSTYNYPEITNRFKILMDKVVSPVNLMYAGGYASGGATFVDHTINGALYYEFKLKNFLKTIQYYSSGEDDIQKNGIYFLYAYDEAVTREFDLGVMLKYTDS